MHITTHRDPPFPNICINFNIVMFDMWEKFTFRKQNTKQYTYPRKKINKYNVAIFFSKLFKVIIKDII